MSAASTLAARQADNKATPDRAFSVMDWRGVTVCSGVAVHDVAHLSRLQLADRQIQDKVNPRPTLRQFENS